MAQSSETRTRVVVEGRWEGSVIPGRMDELLREVLVRPGAVVTGAVLGNRIFLEGPCEVARAVYAAGDLEVRLTGDVQVHSTLAARNTLSVGGPGRLAVEGDVTARLVHLRNAVVRGSVHGDEVRLEGCVVLGAVTAVHRAELDRTAALTASAGELTFKPGCSLILPHARAKGALRVEAPVEVLAFDAPGAALDARDIEPGSAARTLTAGRRVTDLEQVQPQLEAVAEALFRIAFREGAARSPASAQAGRLEGLPERFARLLHEAGLDGS